MILNLTHIALFPLRQVLREACDLTPLVFDPPGLRPPPLQRLRLGKGGAAGPVLLPLSPGV